MNKEEFSGLSGTTAGKNVYGHPVKASRKKSENYPVSEDMAKRVIDCTYMIKKNTRSKLYTQEELDKAVEAERVASTNRISHIILKCPEVSLELANKLDKLVRQ
jgi:hypothetical protein